MCDLHNAGRDSLPVAGASSMLMLVTWKAHLGVNFFVSLKNMWMTIYFLSPIMWPVTGAKHLGHDFLKHFPTTLAWMTDVSRCLFQTAKRYVFYIEIWNISFVIQIIMLFKSVLFGRKHDLEKNLLFKELCYLKKIFYSKHLGHGCFVL